MSSLLDPKTAPISPTPVKYSRTTNGSDKKSLDVSRFSVSHQDMKLKREEKCGSDVLDVIYVGEVVRSAKGLQEIKKRASPVPGRVKEDVKEQPNNVDVKVVKASSPRTRVFCGYRR